MTAIDKDPRNKLDLSRKEKRKLEEMLREWIMKTRTTRMTLKYFITWLHVIMKHVVEMKLSS